MAEATVATRDPVRVLAPLRAVARGGHTPPALEAAASGSSLQRDSVVVGGVRGRGGGGGAGGGRRRRFPPVAENAEGLAALRRRSALALLVFDTYFADPLKRVKGVLASVGAAVLEGRARQAAAAAAAAALEGGAAVAAAVRGGASG